MNKVLEMFKENGEYSLTRALFVAGYILFALVTIYLVYTNQTWGNYTAFVSATGSGALAQLGNKFINSKYNTPLGSAGKTIEVESK